MSKGDAKACVYCGLPAPRAFSETEPYYCCYGCKLAAAIISSEGVQASSTLTRLGVGIFCAMNVMVFTIALWSQDIYGPSAVQDASDVALLELFRYLCLLFSAPVMLLLGAPIAQNAISELTHGRLTADLLIAAGAFAAYIYSVAAVLTGGEHIYFETACMVLVAITLGRWLEATGKQKTSEALRSLKRLFPENARVIQPDGSEALRPLFTVQAGQHIRVLHGERIPVDGRVVEGAALLDQQMITGESYPVSVGAGDQLFAGTLSLDGTLNVLVTSSSDDGALAKIITSLELATATKVPFQKLADRITVWFSPVVALTAILAFVVYLTASGLPLALMTSLSVVLIACPCALGIATPMAFHVALGAAASRGILFRGGADLEQLAAMRAICFDKTGTITTGEPTVRRLVVQQTSDVQLVGKVAAGLTRHASHPLSEAVTRFLNNTEAPQPFIEFSAVQTIAGRGLGGEPSVAGKAVSGACYLGNAALMNESGLKVPAWASRAIETAEDEGSPVVCVGWHNYVRGVFVLAEEIRNGAVTTIESLQKEGVAVFLLTGDHETTAVRQLVDLGVEARTRLLPENKLEIIRQLREEYSHVSMVGDGVNDSPALAAASVSIAMGCGADVSRDTADVCLLSNELPHIRWMVQLSRQTCRVMWQNLIWAFAYNSIGMALALLGWLNPVVAAAAMAGSSLFVVSNSLRLNQYGLEPTGSSYPADLNVKNLPVRNQELPVVAEGLAAHD